jgi:cytochrome P450
LLLDPTTTCSEADPYPLYRRLRDDHPVYRHDDGERPLWVLSRFEDVDLALKDWHTFSNVNSMSDMRSAPGARGATRGEQLITTDPPFHDDLRRVVKEYFAPREIGSLESRIQDQAATALGRLAVQDEATVDVARDFAWPLTLAIISDILGIPEGDRSTLLSWYQTLEYSDVAERLDEELAAYNHYFDELTSRQLADPRDGLISKLMVAVAEGELARPDGLMLCKDLFEGGVDVPANLIANSVLALADHPDQGTYLTEGPTNSVRVRLAVEELARYDPPIQYIPRIATTAISRHGVVIPEGATVLLALGSANRDERRFADPDTLDIARPATRNVAFGAGVHFCIGAPLARLVARVALPQLLTVLGDYDVVNPALRPSGSSVMRGFLSLEVAVSPERVRAAR